MQVNITLLATTSYVGKNTPFTHLEKFYKGLEEVKKHKFDGAIVTGAPVEQMDFEKVAYWEELLEIFDFKAKCNKFYVYLLGCHGCFKILLWCG